jgi:hypothetical protein
MGCLQHQTLALRSDQPRDARRLLEGLCKSSSLRGCCAPLPWSLMTISTVPESGERALHDSAKNGGAPPSPVRAQPSGTRDKTIFMRAWAMRPAPLWMAPAMLTLAASAWVFTSVESATCEIHDEPRLAATLDVQRRSCAFDCANMHAGDHYSGDIRSIAFLGNTGTRTHAAVTCSIAPTRSSGLENNYTGTATLVRRHGAHDAQLAVDGCWHPPPPSGAASLSRPHSARCACYARASSICNASTRARGTREDSDDTACTLCTALSI